MAAGLGSWIALGLFLLYIALVAGGLSLEKTHEISNRQYLMFFMEIGAGVLSFPLVMLVMLLDPQYEVGLAMFILAAVANCYLQGYCIAWIIQRKRRLQAQHTQTERPG
jgi:hypothetical protein